MSELDTTTKTKIKLTQRQRNKIERALKALNEVREELEPKTELEDGINWYLEDNSNLILMDGPTHMPTRKAEARTNGIIEIFELDKSSGGGW